MLNDSNVISLQISTADIMQQIVWIGSSSIRTVRTFVPEHDIPGILGVRVTMVMMALVAKAPAPKILHPLAGEVVDVQKRLPPLGISLDPLAELQMERKMAAKNFARGFPLPRRGPNLRRD